MVQAGIVCNGLQGMLHLSDGFRIVCACRECGKKASASAREFMPSQWEAHCGAGTAKKWKASLKLVPGSVPECPPGAHPMQLGRWFDLKGINFLPARTIGKSLCVEYFCSGGLAHAPHT